jgi:hypothetical protein
MAGVDRRQTVLPLSIVFEVGTLVSEHRSAQLKAEPYREVMYITR